MKSVPRSKHASCWLQKPVSQFCIGTFIAGPTRERAWWLQRRWTKICKIYVILM
jgi:hypothetical protein